MAWRERSAGLVLDPWRFDPAAAVRAANDLILAASGAQALLRDWIGQARSPGEAMAAVIAARLALTPVPPLGRADNFRPDAPALPHHPFIVSCDLPFLPVGAFEAAGAGLAPDAAIDACFRTGLLRDSPFEPGDPLRAATDLLSSTTWDATILQDAKRRASNMVRWQAVRALGRADLLARLDPRAADDAAFDAWWHSCVAQG
jgi:hypothetical protein